LFGNESVSNSKQTGHFLEMNRPLSGFIGALDAKQTSEFRFMRIWLMEAICGLKKETTQPMDEALQRAAQGDSAAFAELVHGHRTMVFSLAYHFLHDRPLAEGPRDELSISFFG
jgi:hypothetical protein